MNRNAKRRNFRVPTIESLEERSLMAGINFDGQVLSIQGRDNYADVAQVILSGSSVKAILNGETKTFAAKSVGAITFYGGAGDDTFINKTSIFSSAHGEAGDDKLFGGSGKDWLEGGAGNDTLNGGSGNDRYVFKAESNLGTDKITDASGIDEIDFRSRASGNSLDLSRTGVQSVRAGVLSINLSSGSAIENVNGSSYADDIFGNGLANTLIGNDGGDRLYGRGGDDRLEGNHGFDVLIGGTGKDKVSSGDCADRVLMDATDFLSDYNKDEDAKITFTNGSSNWTNAEIEVVEQAFSKLYARTNNQLLLRDPVYGPELTFKKVDVTDFSGRNSLSKSGLRTIEIDEWNETNSAANSEAISTVIHEIGHSWDSELEGIDVWDRFKELSGWTPTKPNTGSFVRSTDGNWYHLTNAKFAEDYGKNNPYDDWSTVWETYFKSGYDKSSPIAAKLKIVDGVMTWIKAGMPLGF